MEEEPLDRPVKPKSPDLNSSDEEPMAASVELESMKLKSVELQCVNEALKGMAEVEDGAEVEGAEIEDMAKAEGGEVDDRVEE